MKILNFLFGRKPKITFKPDGTVVHKHTKKYWEKWNNRFHIPDYDWRNHSGFKK